MGTVTGILFLGTLLAMLKGLLMGRKPIGRVNGFMATLKRKLHRAGFPRFDIDDGDHGTKTFRWTGPT